MKYAVEIGLGTTVYIPRFIKTNSSIQKVKGGYTDTQTAWDRLRLLQFIFHKEK
jgi:hypothetical protein